MFYSYQNDVRTLGDKVFNVLNDLKDFKVWIGFSHECPIFKNGSLINFGCRIWGFRCSLNIFSAGRVLLYICSGKLCKTTFNKYLTL